MSKQAIKEIVHNGTPDDLKELYGFTKDTPVEKIAWKFKLFARAN